MRLLVIRLLIVCCSAPDPKFSTGSVVQLRTLNLQPVTDDDQSAAQNLPSTGSDDHQCAHCGQNCVHCGQYCSLWAELFGLDDDMGRDIAEGSGFIISQNGSPLSLPDSPASNRSTLRKGKGNGKSKDKSKAGKHKRKEKAPRAPRAPSSSSDSSSSEDSSSD